MSGEDSRQRLPWSLTAQLVLAIGVILTITMTVAFVLEAHFRYQQALADLTERARLVVTELIATRYVVAIKQPVINRDAEGRVEFKHLNPAAVGRLVAEYFSDATGYRLRQIRLRPRIESNRPEPVEYALLARAMERGDPDPVWQEEATADGRRLFRYVVPLVIGPECLDCHGPPAGSPDIAGFPREGYRVGDIGGGIALTLPMDPFYAQMRALLWQRLALWSALVAATWAVVAWAVRRLVGRPLAVFVDMTRAVASGEWERVRPVGGSREMAILSQSFSAMAQSLRDHHRVLEETVAARTKELAAAVARLEEQGRFRANFLATVSHELKTPLTAILAYAERLARDGEDQAAAILATGRLMESHLNDLLAAARLDGAALMLRREPVDLWAVAAEAVAYLSPLARQRGVRLCGPGGDRTDGPGEGASGAPAQPSRHGGLWVLGDRRRLLQATINLVSNAIKATPPGGKVIVRARESASGIALEVVDEGPGLPEAVTHWLSQPAEAEACERTGACVEAPGTFGANAFGSEALGSDKSAPFQGLGLRIARRLVEAHGGYLAAARPPGGAGTAMQMWIPLGDDVDDGRG